LTHFILVYFKEIEEGEEEVAKKRKEEEFFQISYLAIIHFVSLK